MDFEEKQKQHGYQVALTECLPLNDMAVNIDYIPHLMEFTFHWRAEAVNGRQIICIVT